MPVRAFAYARMPGGRSRGGRELDRQQERLAKFAETHEFEIADTFREVAKKSPSLKESSLNDVILRLHAGEADVLLIEQLACLPGDRLDQEVLVAYLQRHGFRIVAVSEPTLVGNDAFRSFARQFASRLAVFESHFLPLRLRGQRISARRRTGRHEGAKPYGTRIDEKIVLDRITKMHKDGLGYGPIADKLNAEGVRPRRGKKWHPTTIANILGARRDKLQRNKKRVPNAAIRTSHP